MGSYGRPEVRSWVNGRLGKQTAAGTINNDLSLTSAILRHAQDRGWVEDDECTRIAWSGALGWAYLREEEKMYRCLERALERQVWYVKVDPLFAPYRSSPRFAALLERAGLGD